MDHERIRVLLVEDDKVDQMAFERHVRKEGLPYDHKCAGSLKEAREIFGSNDFDVVITDYMLGDGNAFDIFEVAKSDVPIIVVTGAGGEDVAVKALRAGASDYLVKDVGGGHLKTLAVTLENVLKAKRTERELRRYHEQLKKRTTELRATNDRLMREISERERADRELLKSKEVFEAILNATTDSAFLLDSDGNFLALNSQTAQTFRCSPADLLGKKYFDRLPPDLAATRAVQFRQVVSDGIAVRFEDRTIGRILDNSYHPVFDSSGVVESVAVFLREITEQKKAHELLVQRQRVAALGEMASGVAHNFNNLLQVIVGACGTAQIELEFGDVAEAKKTIGRIVESAQKGADTIKQLQDFAGVRTQDPTLEGRVFDLSETAARAAEMSRPLWSGRKTAKGSSGGIVFTRDLGEGRYVRGKEDELFEAVLNLIKNATEATAEGGAIHMSAYVEGDRVCLKIRDSGVGIAPENLARIFEPFWTTKGKQGTGMGLSTSLGIVKRHDGDIFVESEAGRGSTFIIALPSESKAGAEPRASRETETPLKANILLISSQRAIGNVLEIQLTKTGHTVFKAWWGQHGIDMYNEEEVDAIVCDLDMPDINGWQIAKTVKDACESKGTIKTPFILRADGLQNPDEDPRVLECGVDRVLPNLLDVPLLQSAITELVKKKSATV